MRTFGAEIALVSTLLCALPSVGAAQVVTWPMVGRWHGVAEMVTTWTRQRTLVVDIVIAGNDSVTGTVGDAALVQGRFLKNTEAVVSAPAWKSEYVIVAGLGGPVIRAENIWRMGAQILLDWRDDHFEGGISTSGLRVGTVDRQTVAAAVVLRRVPDIPVP
jgi:hypothetical protein